MTAKDILIVAVAIFGLELVYRTLFPSTVPAAPATATSSTSLPTDSGTLSSSPAGGASI